MPGWQPTMMELHISGYNYREIAGELQLSPKYVLAELARAYCTLRMREPDAQTQYSRTTRAKAWMIHELTKVLT